MAFCKQPGCECAKDKPIHCARSNTSGMWSHLKTKHKAIYDKLFPDKLKNQPKLPFASAAACSGPIQPKEDGTRESVRRAQRDFIIRGDHAFTIIEEDGFHWMLEKVKELPVSTPVPFYSAKIITSDTMMLFGGFRGQLVKYLPTLKSRVSFTTDMWTDCNMRGFMGITAHWIDDNWEMVSVVLDFLHVEGHHTGEKLAQAFSGCVFGQFYLQEKIFGVTVDNVSANDKMLAALDSELSSIEFGESLEKIIQNDFDVETNHFRCLGHVLNLVVKKALSAIVTKIEKLRNLAKSIHLSALKSEALVAACKTAEIEAKVIILDVVTRWNSTFNMLERGLYLREALNLMTSKSSSHFLPALAEFQILRKEWEEIIAIVEFLRPFSNITIQCQGDKYVIISSVVAAFNGLMDEC
jgi:hypothetical protein